MNKLPITCEIAAAVLDGRTGTQSAKELQADPKAYLASNFNFTFEEGTDLSVVENSETQQNLTLPYYEGLEPKAASLRDEDLADPSGGYVIWARFETLLWHQQQRDGFAELGIEPGTAEHRADAEANPGRYHETEGYLNYNNK